MQQITDNDCDKGAKKYLTTDGTNKEVRLEYLADEGGPFIELKSKGSYEIKIGYRYVYLPTDSSEYDKIPIEKRRRSKKYYTLTHILTYGKNLHIPWRNSRIDGEIGYCDNIDIIRLVKV